MIWPFTWPWLYTRKQSSHRFGSWTAAVVQGGFLVSWLNNLYEAVLRQEALRPRSSTPAEVRARQRVRDVCQRNLFGLDINPHLVRTCQMNLVLHGDGSSNVFRADSVRTPGEWDDDARRRVPYGKVDLLVTNPPFGGDAKIDDAHVLSQYELPAWDRKDPVSAMPAEQLFVETALRFLRPGGYLVIVLPDGILNNPGLRYIRLVALAKNQDDCVGRLAEEHICSKWGS